LICIKGIVVKVGQAKRLLIDPNLPLPHTLPQALSEVYSAATRHANLTPRRNSSLLYPDRNPPRLVFAKQLGR
jgi:hypothetical protein